MNLLIDITHPARVHQFRHAVRIFTEHGHKVIIAARDKDLIIRLLRLYNFEFQVLTRAQKGYIKTTWEILERTLKLTYLVRKHDIDIILGSASSIPYVSKLTGAKSIAFSTDDADIFDVKLPYALADAVATPACLQGDFGKNHVKYESYHQLAYLHPNRYTPDPGILKVLGVGEGEPYFVLRFVALEAIHDVGHRGISLEMRRRLVKTLSDIGRVFITTEKNLSEEFQQYRLPISPEKVHDVLNYAKLFVGDSQSMTMEAAVLGTPAIRCNTFVGRLSVLEEMENKYGLTYGFLPEDEEKMYTLIMKLLGEENLSAIWQERRMKMLNDKVDLTAWMVDYVENVMSKKLKRSGDKK